MDLRQQMDIRQRSSGSVVEGKVQRQPIRRKPSTSKLGHKKHNKALYTMTTLAIFLILGFITYELTGSPDQPLNRNASRLLKAENEALHKEVEEYREGYLRATGKEGKAVHEKELHAKEEEIEKLHERLAKLHNTKKQLNKEIQDMAKRELIEQYGRGPHYVEVTIAYDPSSDVGRKMSTGNATTGSTDVFLIELAPVDEMPASTFFFLEQVNASVYDGCSFHRNAGHVIQGGPAPNFESKEGENLYKRFIDSGLEHVPFQEYSPYFPHKQYTLGFAGRPGGPDFYVSTIDNTINHGPGGQGNYEDADEADPCFAKVVPGFEHVIDRMHNSEVQDGAFMAFKHNVAIRHMKIFPKDKVAKLLGDEASSDEMETTSSKHKGDFEFKIKESF